MTDVRTRWRGEDRGEAKREKENCDLLCCRDGVLGVVCLVTAGAVGVVSGSTWLIAKETGPTEFVVKFWVVGERGRGCEATGVVGKVDEEERRGGGGGGGGKRKSSVWLTVHTTKRTVYYPWFCSSGSFEGREEGTAD